MKKIIASAVVILGFATVSNAQVTKTAEVHATIVTPITLEKLRDMNFGNIAVQAGNGGSVILTPTATATRSLTGTGVTLPGVTGTVTSAEFKVEGDGNRTYSILYPTTIDLSKGTDKMTVNNFTISTASPNAGVLTAGTQTFYMGGTLVVSAGQPAGDYKNDASFQVTVNYN